MAITVKNITKKFGDFVAIDNVSFDIEHGQLVALLGPSGSGKSTLLRVIAGLETPDSGEIFLTGAEATEVPTQKRNVGFVFQHYALFKHMTIWENIAFGLQVRKLPKEKIKQRVDELLRLVQLVGYGGRYPSQLSGGQRQRVALARALAPQPKVLLLDEPFGALDSKVREELREWIRRLHDEMHVTSLFVTHDQEEALEVSDKVVVINKGKVEQIGTPQDVYENPKTPFVTSFIGPVNVLPGHLFGKKGEDTTYVRPHDVHLTYDVAAGEKKKVLPAIVKRLNQAGSHVKVDLILADGSPIHVHLSRERLKELKLVEGEQVFVSTKETKPFKDDYTI